jgi:hypothetical protein
VGKYTQVLRGLPQYRGEDASFNEKIIAFKAKLGVQSAAQAAQGYAQARAKKDDLDAESSALNVELAAWEELMHDCFEHEGISSLKLSTGESINTYPEPYAQIADPQAFRDWCSTQEDLANRMTLPWSTTNSITKERLLDGEEPPPGVKIFVKTKTRLSR